MVFWIILITVFAIAFTASCIYNYRVKDCEGWMMVNGFTFLGCLIFFGFLMMQRNGNISSYHEAKAHPEYFTNEMRINNNNTIAIIKAHQGTIFSFYNGIEFEYFEIEDGSKVIIKE